MLNNNFSTRFLFRLLVRDAAKHLDLDAPEKVAMCAMAKLHATDNCFEVCFNDSLDFNKTESYRLSMEHFKCLVATDS